MANLFRTEAFLKLIECGEMVVRTAGWKLAWALFCFGVAKNGVGVLASLGFTNQASWGGCIMYW